MKKFILTLILCVASVITANATQVQVTGNVVNYANLTGLGPTKTAVVTVTNGSTNVTGSATLPANLTGLGGWLININGSDYEVSNQTSTSALVLRSAYNGASGSTTATIYPVLTLKIYADKAFTPLGASYIVQPGGPTDPNGFYRRIGCSYKNSQIIVPTITLDTMVDAATATHRLARYGAYFTRLDNSLVRPYMNFTSFQVPAEGPVTWDELSIYNSPAITYSTNPEGYSKGQVDSLVNDLSVRLHVLEDLQVTPEDYGAMGDGRQITGAIAVSSNVFTATTAAFVESDVTKTIVIVGAGAQLHTDSVHSPLITTITKYLSSSSVEVASPAIASVSGVATYFYTDDTAAFTAAQAAVTAAGRGKIQLSAKTYGITQFTLKNNTILTGLGPDATVIWSAFGASETTPIDGIIKIRNPINSSTRANIEVSKIRIEGLNQTEFQSCLDDVGSTYLRISDIRVLGCHWGVILDQTELSSVENSIFESYYSGRSGKFNIGTAPENTGWTKVGSVASSVEPMVFPDDCWQCGRVTLSPTGTDTTYWKTGITGFEKGFLFVTQTPEVVGVTTNIGRAATQVLDDGTHHFEINWKGYLSATPLAANWAATTSYAKYQVAKATASVGGFTSGDAIYSNSARTSSGVFDAAEAANWTSAVGMHGFQINNTGPLYPAPFGTTALAINPGGTTAALYLSLSSTADTIASSTIAATASTGTMMAFGDFDATNNNNASVYWNQFEWQGTWPTATALWMPPNDDHWQHRETYTRTGAAMYAGDNQVICRSCTMGPGDVDKSVTVVGAGASGANLTATINSYFGDAYVFTTATATPSDTSFSVTNNLNIASPGAWLYSGGEAFYCTGSTATTITGCTRGLLGSTARTFAVGDSINVYRTWRLSSVASTSVGINSSTGASVLIAESAGPQFVNVIQIYNNQFNGPNVQIKDEGGYSHKLSGNNFNGGGIGYSNSGSYSISIENSDFEGQSAWPIVLGDSMLLHPTLRGSAYGVDIMHNLLPSVKLWQGHDITFTNNLFSPGSGSAIYNSTGGSVGGLNATGNSTQGARLFQQNIGLVEGNRLGGLIPLSANGGLTVGNYQTRYDRPVTGPLELHYRSLGSEEEPRGALGAITAGSKTLVITSKYSSTRFYGYGGDTSGKTDVGKTIKVEYAAAANGANAVLTTTIASVTNSTTVVLTDAAVQTVTNVNTIWYREGAKTPAITFYDAYDLYGANWTNGPTTLSNPTLTISAISDYSGTVPGTVRATVDNIGSNAALTLALASVPWTSGSLTLKISGTTDYNHYAKTVTYIDPTHVYWTDTYTSSQTGTASYLVGTDPTAPASTLTPKNYFARLQGLSGYTQNQTVNMLDASGYMGVTDSILGTNYWLFSDANKHITGTTNATMDASGNGMVRYLAIKAANASGTNTMLDFKTSGNLLAWSWFYDVTGGWLTLQDGNASRQQLTVIPNATYDYLQLHANEGINWAGYGTTYTSAGGIAKNGSSMLEINRGKKIADGGATGDLLLRNLRMQLSGASSAVYFNYTGTPTAARAIAMPDMSSTFVGSNGALTAGRIPFGVAIDSGVGVTDSANFTFDVTTGLVVKGSTIDSSQYVAIFKDSSGGSIFSLRNDQQFVMGNGGSTATQLTISSSSASAGIYSPAYSSNSSNLIKFKDFAGNIRMYLDMSSTTDGKLGINMSSAPGAQLQVNTGATGTIGIISKAIAGQTADLFQAQDSTSAVLAKVDKSGYIYSGAWVEIFSGTTYGALTANGASNGLWLSAATSGGGTVIRNPGGGFEVWANGSNNGMVWTSSAGNGYNAGIDTGLFRTSARKLEVNNGTVGTYGDLLLRQLYADATMTAGGTTGAQTINKSAGSVNFAAAATSLVVTDSLVTANSIVVCTIMTNDATMTSVKCVPTSGSFTIYANAAATAETKVGFIVINQ